MREFDLLADYPQPQSKRIVTERNFKNRLIASERGYEFFDGDRANGYGGMSDDNRWLHVAQKILDEYLPATCLQINAEKGFLLKELVRKGVVVCGTEESIYALDNAVVGLHKMAPTFLTYQSKTFDLAIALGPVYTQSLTGAIQVLKELQRVAHKQFVTLATYESEDDYRLLRAWSLLGTTILKRSEWLDTMAFAGYTGDYKFVDALSLNLMW